MHKFVLIVGAILGALFVYCPPGVAKGQKSEATQKDSSRGALGRWLKGVAGAEAGEISILTDDAFTSLFPRHNFYVMRFRMFPVGQIPPEPLSTNNIFSVTANGAVTHITNEKKLFSFFKSTLPSAREKTDAKATVQAWLKFAQEFRQDGFFVFAPPAEVKVNRTENRMNAQGKITALRGGIGDIKASLVFDAEGKLLSAKTDYEDLKTGIRPICQATKLLDEDLIVRKMAEQDILVMGRAAKPYLDEQRSKATPELQQEIDRVWHRIVQEKW